MSEDQPARQHTTDRKPFAGWALYTCAICCIAAGVAIKADPSIGLLVIGAGLFVAAFLIGLNRLANWTEEEDDR